MFGINDIADLAPTIYASEPSSLGGKNKDLSTPRGRAEKASSLLRKGVQTFQLVSSAVANSFVMSQIHEYLFCIDDVERRNDKVALKDVLGTAAHLRDVRKCKVVVIFNEDSFEDGDQEVLRTHSEKVFERTLRVDPTPKEAADIAFHKPDSHDGVMQATCISLEIVNIRLMMKIRSRGHEFVALLGDVDPDVCREVLSAFVVAAWCALSSEKDGAPTHEFLTKRLMAVTFETDKPNDKEAAWLELLTQAEFTGWDQVDDLLFEGVRKGFFDKERLNKALEEYLPSAADKRAADDLLAAGKLLRKSLNDNSNEVAAAFYEACLKHRKVLSVRDIARSVLVIKACGEPEMAREVIVRYSTHRGRRRSRARRPGGSCSSG